MYIARSLVPATEHRNWHEVVTVTNSWGKFRFIPRDYTKIISIRHTLRKQKRAAFHNWQIRIIAGPVNKRLLRVRRK
jgi:hypothetical protein